MVKGGKKLRAWEKRHLRGASLGDGVSQGILNFSNDPLFQIATKCENVNGIVVHSQ